MALAPACSRSFASSTALMLPLSQPLRILTVTGTGTACVTASTIRAAFSGSRIKALPSPFPAIFGIGQPMLMSIKSAPECSSASAAPSAITAGSLPKICAPQMPASVFRSKDRLFLSLYTISVTVMSAPSCAAMQRYAQSVTPAIGARTMGLSMGNFPSCIRAPPFCAVSAIIPQNGSKRNVSACVISRIKKACGKELAAGFCAFYWTMKLTDSSPCLSSP